MEEKTYLKWYNKVGYGTGDIAGNVVYAFLSSFVMIYLTKYSWVKFGHSRYIDSGIKNYLMELRIYFSVQ